MQKWEFLSIDIGNVGGKWLPQFVNGKELPNWKKISSLYDFMNQLGEQGWELVGGTPNERFFKRSKQD